MARAGKKSTDIYFKVLPRYWRWPRTRRGCHAGFCPPESSRAPRLVWTQVEPRRNHCLVRVPTGPQRRKSTAELKLWEGKKYTRFNPVVQTCNILHMAMYRKSALGKAWRSLQGTRHWKKRIEEVRGLSRSHFPGRNFGRWWRYYTGVSPH